MSTAPKIVVTKTWEITTVDFQDARLLESYQIESISKELYRLIDEMDRKKIVLDFSKVQFLASAAIGMLMTLNNKANAVKGQLVICGMRKEIMKVFEIMKLTKVFKFAPDEPQALKMLGYNT